MAKKKEQESKKSAKPKKLHVKDEAFGKLTDKEMEGVAGGLRRAGTTTNPTGSDGCCGAN